MTSLRDSILTMEGRAVSGPDPDPGRSVVVPQSAATTVAAHRCRGVADDERWHLGQREVHLTCACGNDLGWRKARAGEQVAG